MTPLAGWLAAGAVRPHGFYTLRARTLLPLAGRDDASGAGRPLVIDNGWVRVARGRIAAVGGGPRGGRDARADGGTVVDCGDAILLPGFVNAHTHLEFSDRDRPLDVAGGLPDWIARVVALRRGRGGQALGTDPAAAIARGLAESARAGVTSVGEIATGLAGWLPPAGGWAALRVRVFREGLGLSAAAMAAAGSRMAADLAALDSAGLAAGISPHAPYTVGRPLGRRLMGLAVARRLPVAMHVAESREEAELLATGGGRLRELLESLGAWPEAGPELLPAAEWISRLARAPRGIVVHGTFLPDDAAAFARLVRHRDRLVVAVCPRTTHALSGVLPPVRAFLEAGIRVALGTDSRASNPDLDLRAEGRALADAGVASPAEILRMATRHGAFALGFERRTGRLAPGYSADVAVLMPRTASGDPCADALAATTSVAAAIRGGRPVASRA